MTSVGHIVYLCPSQHHLRPRSARAQIMLLGPQINYMPSKSHVMVLFALGFAFAYDSTTSCKINFEEKLVMLENILNQWTSRNLTLKGRIKL